MTDTLGDFLNKVGKVPLLTPDEEILLSRQVQQWLQLRHIDTPTKEQHRTIKRGRRAYDRFFTSNIRLAIFVAKQFASKATTMTLDDLIQEGCIGLARGIEKFDAERGYKFSTYAYWWIRQSISRAIEMQDRMIRLPINSLQQMAKVRRFMLKHQIEHGCMPSLEQCCEVSGLSMQTYKSCMHLASDCHSLDSVANRQIDSDTSLKDLIADHRSSPMEHLELEINRAALAKWQNMLTDLEKDILDAHYGLNGQAPESLTQIGKRFSVSREQVRIKEQTAIRKMRYQAAA